MTVYVVGVFWLAAVCMFNTGKRFCQHKMCLTHGCKQLAVTY